MIAFTGSREIGCRIFERAAKVQPGQKWLKRVMAEMGGKDATVVCADADLDAAALGIAQAAFGYSGQKCSACSRAIVEDSVYDEVLEKVLAHARKLKAGLPEDNADYGPVIHAGSAERIRGYVEAGKASAKLLLGGEWEGRQRAADHLRRRGEQRSPVSGRDFRPGADLHAGAGLAARHRRSPTTRSTA